MTSSMEYHIGPPIVELYYDANHDFIVVAAPTTAYTILYLGSLDGGAPSTPVPTVLLKFL